APAGSARPQHATARYARRPADACGLASARRWDSDPAVAAASRRNDDGVARGPRACLQRALPRLAPARGAARAMTDPDWGDGLLAAVAVVVFLCFVLDLWWRGSAPPAGARPPTGRH